MKLKAIGLAMMLAVGASSARAYAGCREPIIPAGAQVPEVLENTPAQTEVKVSGVLTLTNTAHHKAQVTLILRAAGQPDKERHVTVGANDTRAIPYVLKEDSAFFAVAVEATEPMVCESSDVVY